VHDGLNLVRHRLHNVWGEEHIHDVPDGVEKTDAETLQQTTQHQWIVHSVVVHLIVGVVCFDRHRPPVQALLAR